MLGDASIRSDTTVRQLDNLVALSEYEMFGTDHTRVRSSSSLRLTAAVRLRLESGKHVLRNFGLRNDKRIGRYLRLFFLLYIWTTVVRSV